MMDTQEIVRLVRNVQAGDTASYDNLTLAFEEMVLGVAMRYMKNSSDADDLKQDIFLHALRKIDQINEPERFAGWLKQVAVRMSINRATRGPKDIAQGPEVMSSLAESNATPAAAFEAAETASLLHESIARLGDLDRSTLQAFYFDGQSVEEMSGRFEAPVGTIKRRLHDARRRLREELGDLHPN